MSKDEDANERSNQPAGHPPPARPGHASLIDQIMAKAQADGLMENLPGQGQPLKLDDDEMVPAEYRLGFRMLKTSGFAPPWIEARREIDEVRAQTTNWLNDARRRWPYLAAPARAALRVAYRRKLDDLQRLIMNFNLKAPPGIDHVEGLCMADELGKLDA
jgi:DnaJ homologue, subfamily C, member 28, conserved domain